MGCVCVPVVRGEHTLDEGEWESNHVAAFLSPASKASAI